MQPLAKTVATALLFVVIACAHGQESPSRVTILYDAFGKQSPLKRGWGYSALVEYGGKRILFDTGGQVNAFAFNIESLAVDLTRLDFVVLTHRHGDHTAGLNHVLKVNPRVKIYTPLEPAYFNMTPGPAFVKDVKRRVESAPDDMHYFDGQYPDRLQIDSPWPDANFTQIAKPTEIAPGFWLLPTQSDVPGTKEMNELSLAIKTSQGLLVFVGCSHPGIEKILGAATQIEPRVYGIYGGLHLLGSPDPQVSGIVASLRDKWGLQRVAAGHCTGEFGFSELNRIFGSRFDNSGVGSVIPLPR